MRFLSPNLPSPLNSPQLPQRNGILCLSIHSNYAANAENAAHAPRVFLFRRYAPPHTNLPRIVGWQMNQAPGEGKQAAKSQIYGPNQDTYGALFDETLAFFYVFIPKASAARYVCCPFLRVGWVFSFKNQKKAPCF